MFQLIWGSVYRFLNNMTKPLNSSEKDQPAPLEVQRQHLKRELENVEAQIAAKRFQEIDNAQL